MRAIALEDQCSYPYLRLDILNSPILHKIWKCNVMLHIIPFSIMIVTFIRSYNKFYNSSVHFPSFLLLFSMNLRKNIFFSKFEMIIHLQVLQELLPLRGWYDWHPDSLQITFLPLILRPRRLVMRRLEFLWI